ncbi:ESX secretion-associated protein EspG [Pseudonocardiaceae bacterium YIM PH 21723]|nr:ESX secretion-associated protein EspG [Pseudonocardiaceae bacterium YIM PH 21723]
MWTAMLQPAEFNALWRRLNLGERSLVLNPPDATDADQQAEAELRKRCLIDGDGRTIASLSSALRTLARPTWELDLRWAPEVGAEYRVLVAADNETAAVGSWDRQVIRLAQVQPESMIKRMVDQLGRVSPGHGQSVSVPAAALDRAASGGSAWDIERTLVSGGLSSADASTLIGMFGAKRLRAGQIGAAAWDAGGTRHRAPWVLTVFDTVRGRYVMYERRSMVTVSPVSREQLSLLLTELLDSAHHTAQIPAVHRAVIQTQSPVRDNSPIATSVAGEEQS